MLTMMDVYKKHVKGTSKGDLAPDIVGSVCTLETSVRKKLKVESPKVYIKARALKHIYERVFLDAKKPEVFTLLVQRMPKVLSKPDRICKNKAGKKRGEYCFLKNFGEETYLCVVEVKNGSLFVATSFIPKANYLRRFVSIVEF